VSHVGARQGIGMRIVPAIWRRQYGLGRWSSQGAFLLQSKHERESQWAFQVFLSVKNRPRFLSKLESGPIPLNIALLRVYLILAQITVYYTLYIYAATEQLYILAIFPTDNHRFQNSINNDENYLLS